MDWLEEFRENILSAEEAASFVKSGDCVFVSLREPYDLCLALVDRKEELKKCVSWQGYQAV